MTILQNVMEAPVTVLKRDPAEVEAKARHYLAKVGIAEKGRGLARAAFGGAATARGDCPRPVHGTARVAVR
jgi:polar amino acid transport system ATP-binding protein